MYLAIILSLMIAFPVVSILAEASSGTSDIAFLVGKWFVFWAVGIRLLTAGVRQVMTPSFTAVSIFRITDPSAEKLVTEIGFGNLTIGLIAALSLIFPDWLVPAGLTGALYLALACIKHVVNKDRSLKENVAMISDLGAAVIIAISLSAWLLR